MKKIAVLFVLMVASSPALAEGLYVGGYVGPGAVDSTKLNWEGPVDPSTFEFDLGFNVGIIIGTSINDNLRVEGEFVYSSAPATVIDALNVDGDITAVSLGTNLIYDFSGDRMRPYIGGGLVVVSVDASDVTFVGNPIFEGNVVTGGAQAILGLSIPFESITLFADYRFLVTAPVELTAAVSGDRVRMDNYVRNSFMFGVRAEF